MTKEDLQTEADVTVGKESKAVENHRLPEEMGSEAEDHRIMFPHITKATGEIINEAAPEDLATVITPDLLVMKDQADQIQEEAARVVLQTGQ